jgi:hypothetical protein
VFYSGIRDAMFDQSAHPARPIDVPPARSSANQADLAENDKEGLKPGAQADIAGYQV